MNDYIYTSYDKSNKLFHIGTPHEGRIPHSGRYPWGSGEKSLQRATDLRAFAYEYRRKINPETGKKYTDTEIARAWGISTTDYRKILSVDKNQERAANIAKASQYKDQGLSYSEIAEKMNEPESTVRSWLLPKAQERANSTKNVAEYLKNQVDDKLYLDVSKGVGAQLNISNEKLKNAILILQDEGYILHTIKVEQATNPTRKTTIQVLTKGDKNWNEVWENRDKIRSPLGTWFEDNGKTNRNVREPVSIDSSRIMVNYGTEDGKGGALKEGLIEIRPGVADLSMGQNTYTQVRIAVDGTHYIKGMAVYSDDIPEGKDIIFNTYKSSDVPLMGDKNNTILKPLKSDPDNPFGATIRQYDYVGEDGKMHQSAINIVNDEADWSKWSRTLSAQMLSKQPVALAKRQLYLVYQEKKDLYDEIKNYPNDTIKKKLLYDLAEDCDSTAVHLKAAALPRQETKVIIPIPSLKDNEIYAPTYKNGEEVVLIRYPHQGIFEIPRLIVNNNNKEGKRVLGDAPRAVGINSTVAVQLSGADFDGDTVTVIPTVNQNIKTSKPLKALENFNPKEVYKAYEGMTPVGPKKKDENDNEIEGSGDGFNTQREMGRISNLITDMTIKGATEAELVRATKHALVVIDAEKHQLNWKQSEKDQNIKQLKEKYQTQPGRSGFGAATIISKSKGRQDVLLREPRYDINPNTGEKIYYVSKDAVWYDKNTGERHERTERSTRMAEAKDAYELVSRDENGLTQPIEIVYADHANRLKALANEIRKEIKTTPNGKLNSSAQKQYESEVKSLEDKIRLAEMNAPNERLAQAAASVYIASKKKEVDMTKEEEKKMRAQVIAAMRSKAGALEGEKRAIKPTDSEWEAIVAGGLSTQKINKILSFMDTEEVLRRTVPKESVVLSTAKKNRAQLMLKAGYSWSDVADAVGVSESTLRKYLRQKGDENVG